MGSILKTAATIGALTLTLGSAAQAADLPRSTPSMPLPPMIQSAPSLVDEFASGWYLRGDVGYRFNRVDETTNAAAAVPVTADDLDKSWMIGAGVGFKWQWFRADLTADYGMQADYSGTTSRIANDFTAKIDSFTVLANVYGDLGTWFGLTPYIGAGIGTARLGTSDFSQHFLPTVAGVDETSKWNLAWAVMAGISYKITENFHIDLGYRHLAMGDVSTGRDSYGNQLTFNKVSADEIRLGVRYLID